MIETVEAPSLRRRALQWTQIGLHKAGVGAAYSAFGGGGAVVLMYHSVAGSGREAFIDPAWRMAPVRFRRQMEFLAKHRRVLALDALVEELAAGRTPERGSVVITFDDGYLDNLEVAAPILAELSLPATLFVPTAYIDRGLCQLGDRLYTMLRSRTQHRLDAGVAGNFELSDAGRTGAAFRAIAGALITLSLDARETLLDDLAAQLKPSQTPPRLTLTWDELRELRSRYPRFDVGSHTTDHIDVSAHPQAVGVAAIDESRARLSAELGEPPRHFCFPFNRSTPGHREAVEAAGFVSGMCSGGSELLRAGSDLFHVARIDPNLPNSMFEFVTGGAYPNLPKRLFGRY